MDSKFGVDHYSYTIRGRIWPIVKVLEGIFGQNCMKITKVSMSTVVNFVVGKINHKSYSHWIHNSSDFEAPLFTVMRWTRAKYHYAVRKAK